MGGVSGASAVRLAVLWLALSAPGAVAQPQEPPPDEGAIAKTVSDNQELRLVEATHERLIFDSGVLRYAVGRSERVRVEAIDDRQLLLLGLSTGRSSLFVWLADGTTLSLLVSVEPDLSLLRDALLEIHPSLSVELAPDRLAFLLRGLVDDVTQRDAAEQIARAYLSSERSGRRGPDTPLLQDSGEGDVSELPRLSEDDDVGGAAVLNLIRLVSLPPAADKRIRAAVDPLTGGTVSVRRVLAGDRPDDGLDVFVLEGKVPDQVTLSRVLFLAANALGGPDSGRAGGDLRVLTDEAGGLAQARSTFGAGSGGGSGNQFSTSLIGSVIGGAGGGGAGGQQGIQLANRIGTNIGRAKLIEAAGGRLLSMVEVEDLPLVRVDVRLYEVDLNRLRQWRNELTLLASDFDQGGLLPSGLAEGVQGTGAALVGDSDVQDVLGFVDGGLANDFQFVYGGFAVDNAFQFLASKEIARSISRPSLTVLSGEQALFQVGGEIPVPVAVTAGSGSDQVLNGVLFKEFGIQLSIRPLVEEVESENMTLDIAPIISQPDLGLTSAIGAATGAEAATTAFERRGTRTHTRLRDGDALLIAGLVTEREQVGRSKVPFLGDIPVLGWLFRNESRTTEEFELVIVVTPTIVRPIRPDAFRWAFTGTDSVLRDCLEAVSRGAAPTASEDEPAQEDLADPERNSASGELSSQ